MKKSIVYFIIFIFVSLICFFAECWYRNYYKNYKENKSLSIEYLDYNFARDFTDIDNLMETYKFWLFHGDYKKGECPLYPNFKSETHTSDFDSNLNVPYFIKIARVENRCVGFITYYISDNLTAEGDEVKKLGRIHLLCVDEKFRRLGIANNLVEMVINFFKENNCQKVYLMTRPENIRAKGLYYKLGFNEVNKNDNIGSVFDKDPADILLKEF